MLGAKVVLQESWEPYAAADLIEGEGCTFTVGATPFLLGLLDEYEQRRTASSLRVFACGGADVPPQLVRDARHRLQAAVVRIYGSTEYPTLSCSHPDDPSDKAAETDGRLIMRAECRIVDDGRELPQGQVGEIAVNGPERFLGYLDPALNKDSFTEDGFFLTGDLAAIDTDGFITIHGRKKDIIIRSGEKVSAKEVEDLLFEHPAVAEVAVVAVPDPKVGEKAYAYVVLVPGAQFDFAEMTSYLASRRVARQKYPEYMEVLSTGLPKTASGKVQKFRLREDAVMKVLATSGLESPV
jgi:cyclohexanecarboxylate-CoA ligase